MSPQQRARFLQAVDKLVGEHCHGFIFAAEVDCDEADEAGRHDTGMIVSWSGGATMAAGLASRLYNQLSKRDDLPWDEPS